MGNNLSVTEQLALFRDIVWARPLLGAILAILLVFGIAFGKSDPMLWRLSALLTEPDREIETLIVANPNVDMRQVIVELSPRGAALDLGIDQATALDLESKGARLARLNVSERSVSVVTILRKKEHGPSPTKAVPPTLQSISSDSIMRQLAVSYLLGLLLYAASFGTWLTVAWTVLTGVNIVATANPRVWKTIALQRLGDAVRWPPRSTTKHGIDP